MSSFGDGGDPDLIDDESRPARPPPVVIENTTVIGGGAGWSGMAANAAGGLVAAMPSILGTVFGTPQTDQDRVHDAQRQVARQARRSEREEYMLRNRAAKAQQAVEAQVRRGAGGDELRRTISEKVRNQQRLDRKAAVTTKLQDAADGLDDTAANLNMTAAAATTTDVLIDVNHHLSANGHGELASQLERQTALMQDRTEVVSAALGQPNVSATAAAIDREYEQAMAAILIQQHSASSAAAAAAVPKQRAAAAAARPLATSSSSQQKQPLPPSSFDERDVNERLLALKSFNNGGK